MSYEPPQTLDEFLSLPVEEMTEEIEILIESTFDIDWTAKMAANAIAEYITMLKDNENDLPA